jgi:diguanylate cyclase (GGDEF)-like protein
MTVTRADKVFGTRSYGGEEFIVLLPGCATTAAEAVVRRLRAVTPGEATFSAGIARWDGRETADQLVARADGALYDAKTAGRDRSVVARPTDPAPASDADVGPLGAGIHSGPDAGTASRTL